MFIIMGGTGHVGSVAARDLLALGQNVTIVTHDPAKAAEIEKRGATAAVVDVLDVKALRAVLKQGRRLFMLNPPAAPTTDTDVEERKTVAAMIEALDGSGLEAIVAESTYGAQPGERKGDLNTLHAMEAGLAEQPIPHAIIRAAYYMSNWDMALATARNEGVVNSMFPVEFALPTVAPRDLGAAAAELLRNPEPSGTIRYVEGPRRYSAGDVARAFSASLDREVVVTVAPRNHWAAQFKKLGFSDAAADSYARMTGITLDGDYDSPDAPQRGTTTLESYVDALVKEAAASR
ncbi:uncharacterized protein YbjT (DUF2867 family) [Sphingomonas sp. UYAg733]